MIIEGSTSASQTNVRTEFYLIIKVWLVPRYQGKNR